MKHPVRAVVLAASLVLFATSGHAQVGTRGTITIRATAFRSDDGRLRCFLYDQADAFPTHPERAYAGAMGRISGGRATCTFADVPPGRYAIGLHHDQNSDGRLDTGLFGIPTEGFADAAFDYAGGALTLDARIGYIF